MKIEEKPLIKWPNNTKRINIGLHKRYLGLYPYGNNDKPILYKWLPDDSVIKLYGKCLLSLIFILNLKLELNLIAKILLKGYYFTNNFIIKFKGYQK